MADDDLDDLLDNVLDDFSKPAPAASSSRGADAPTSVPGFDDPELDDELAKELARGMDQLLNGMSEHPDLKSQMEALVQTLEKDMPALAQAAGESAGQAAAASGKGKAKAEKTSDAFQDKIQETLNKMRSGQEKVGSEVMDGMNDDMMAEMMKQMEGLVESGEFNNALEGMMEQLMTKDVLYEPMKDLADRYPAWLEKNKSVIDSAALNNYSRQYDIVSQIVKIYESSTSSSPEGLKRVADLMTQMQETGNPPDDIIKELAPDMEFGPDGPKMSEKDCSIM